MERYTLSIKQENEYEITESGIVNGCITGLGENITIAQYEIEPQQQIHHATMMLQHPQIIIHQQRIPQQQQHHMQQQQLHHIQHVQHITPSSTPNHLQHHTIQIHNEEESDCSSAILYTNNTHSQCNTPHIQIQIHRADGSRPNSVQHIPAELVQVSSPIEVHSPHFHNQHQQIIIHQPMTTIIDELQPQELEVAHQEEIITIPTQMIQKIEYPELSITPQFQEQQYLPQDNININIVCKVCKENFVGVGNFTEHMKTHMPHEQVYEDVMGATRIEMVDLSETLNMDKSAYPCAFCNKKYIWHKFLVTHSKCHKTPAPFICTICGESFDCLYYDHMKTHILSEGRTCAKCNENFTTLKALKQHVRTVHNPHLSGDANHQHKCSICGKHYKALSYLKEHERTHTGEKPYKCDVCGKAFAKYGCWAEHKKTHSIVKAFKCPMCPKAFTKRRYLKAHLLRHPKTLDLDKIFVEDRDGELPSRKFLFAPNKPKPAPKVQPKLECPICYKEFKKMRYLRSHVIRHPEGFVRQKLGLKPGVPIPPLLPAVLNRKSAMISATDNPQELTNIQIETKLEMSSEDESTDDENLAGEEEDVVGLEKGEVKTDMEYVDNDFFNNDGLNEEEEEFDENTVKQQIPSPEEINNTTMPHESSNNNSEIVDNDNVKPVVDEISLLPEPTAEPTIFCCSVCQKSFNQAKLLRDHELVHYGENPYKCSYCNTAFVMWTRYEDHMTFEHNDFPLFCDADEEKKLKSLGRYFNSEEKSFTCRTCGETFLSENMLDEHEDMHLGEEPLKCRVCAEYFAIQTKYAEHLKGHGIENEILNLEDEEEVNEENTNMESEDKIKIEIDTTNEVNTGNGGRVLRSRAKKNITSNLRNQRIRKLRRTIRKKTRNEKPKRGDDQTSDENQEEKDEQQEPDKNYGNNDVEMKGEIKEDSKKRYKCKICSKQYTTLFYLKEHLSIHSGNRPHKCKTCGKTFAASSCYREHLELHSSQKNHKCDMCGMTFAVPRYLRAHMRRHAQKTRPDGGKKYNCPQCEKKYQSKTALVEHMKIHTGEAPFTCTYCGKVFMLTSSFRDHMLKHENVEMHQCPFCPKSFIKARYLQQHLVRHIQKLDTEDNGDLAATPKNNDTKAKFDNEFEDSASSSSDTDSEDEFFKNPPPPEDGQTLV